MNSMKKLTIYLFSLLMCMSYISCERGDLYYEDYSNSINTYDGDIYSYLEQNKGVFDSLLLVLDRIYPYQDSLKNQDITLFAPTNQSFTLALLNLNTQRRLANNPPIYLEDIDRNELDTLLSRYIFNDVIST